VGVSTVSRVFNKHPDVGAETREKVLQVAKELGYRPNSCARQLVRDTTETICFVMSNRDVISQFHSKVLVGVEEYAGTVAHSVIFMRFDYAPNTPPEDLALPRVLWERGTVDGVIIAGTNYPNFVRVIKNLGIPFVLFGNNLIGRMPVGDIDTIWFDTEGGCRCATEHLLGLGHQRVWFLGDTRLPWYRRCYRGYVAAMEQQGLKPQSLEVDWTSSLFECGVNAAERVAELGEQVTAVVAGDDEIALGVLTGLTRRSIRVPEDVSLVGFDDIDEIKYVHPPLTTIRVPKEKVGENLARVLFDRLANPGAPFLKRVIPTELVVRESTAAPKPADTPPVLDHIDEHEVVSS